MKITDLVDILLKFPADLSVEIQSEVFANAVVNGEGGEWETNRFEVSEVKYSGQRNKVVIYCL